MRAPGRLRAEVTWEAAQNKAFVDYSGDRLHLVDRQTGARVAVELFVGALGASNYTFADVTLTQRGPDFLASHVRMLEHFGGVPAAIVPDQLKSGVTRSCWNAPMSLGAPRQSRRTRCTTAACLTSPTNPC